MTKGFQAKTLLGVGGKRGSCKSKNTLGKRKMLGTLSRGKDKARGSWARAAEVTHDIPKALGEYKSQVTVRLEASG